MPDNISSSLMSKNEFLVVGIGASAGGIQALRQFFQNVKEDSGIAYVVILHLSPDHDSKLTEIIRLATKIPVAQVTQKIKVLPDNIYVISPNHHLTIADGEITSALHLHEEERRAPVDIFFRTLAESHHSKAVCVILSGTGANGSMGLKRIKENGGAAFVQSPQEAEFNEMPRHAIATDLVDAVMPVAAIPDAILNYKARLGSVQITAEPKERPPGEQAALKEIFHQLRLVTTHDFSNYKRATLLRRIERRITVKNQPDLESYAAFLKAHPEETHALLKDLLISVTNFFRDAKAFTTVETEIIPSLLKKKKAEEQLRIWVAGCATGDEAYSIAMLCTEQTLNIIDAPKVQIFATDIDEGAIAIAREGYYTINDAADVSPERLRKFFNKEGNGYRIKRELREMILFAHHNFLKDPPFSHIDLVSCRNVLIYLNRSAQKRVLETFHFALNTGGYLFLGLSESVEASGNLFEVVNREQHIFKSRQVAVRAYPVPESIPALRLDHPHETPKEKSSKLLDRITYGDLHQRILEQYAPPSLIVNEEYEIVHLSERAAPYLQFAGGEPSQNLLKVIRPELRLELRSALFQATQQRKAVEIKGLMVQSNTGSASLNLHVKPVLREADIAKGYFLVLFERTEEKNGNKEVIVHSDTAVSRHLEEELMRVKAQLRSANEQHEFQAEELKANNEELQAMNEELRSATEELETSREELQSMNEELRTVNQELKIKIEETAQNNNNLRNLINSSNVATIFLDRSLKIAMFTPSALDAFNLIPGDLGRPLSDITHRLTYNGLLSDAEKVLEKLAAIEREVSTIDGHIFLMHVLPYRTTEDLINGVVITFVDITRRKRSEEALLGSQADLKNFITATNDAVFRMDADWGEMCNLKGLDFIAGPGKFSKDWLDRYIPAEEQDRFLKAKKEAINSKSVFELEHKVIREDYSQGWVISRAIPVLNDQNKITEWFGAAADITLRKQTEEALHVSEERFRLMSESGLLAIAVFSDSGQIIDANTAFFNTTGYDRNDLLDGELSLDRLTPDEWKARTEMSMKELSRDGIFAPFEKEYLKKDGTRAWGLFGGARFNDRMDVLFFMLDVTPLKELEKQKESFISIASHELKTPVTSIRAYSELLKEKLHQSNDKTISEMVSKLNEQVHRLNLLINDLLDATRITEKILPLKKMQLDLNELIKMIREDLQLVYPAHPIIFNSSTLPLIMADRDRITQVINNIIQNAVKYSAKGEKIVIETEQADNYVKVIINDHGIGIAANVLDKVFDRFFRINNPQLQVTPGLGLGLYISAGIVEAHGGTVGVDSKDGEGSSFYFTLPCITN